MTDRIDEILTIEDPTEFAIALSDHVFGRPGPEGFSGLTEAEQTVYCIAGLERDVNNGGFAQFFLNSSGDQASAASLWSELDDAFYEYRDDLTGLLRTYVRSTRDQFPK